MKFDIPCGQGRLQITDDGYLQQVNAWKRVAWSVPARTVGGVSSRRHGLALHVTVETLSAHHTVTTVTNQNYERLRAALAEFQYIPAPHQYAPPPVPAFQAFQPTMPPPPIPSTPPPFFTPAPAGALPDPRRPWYRRMRKRTWAIIVAVILVLAVANAIANGSQGTGSAAQSTPTSAAQGQATTASTPVSVPTQVPTQKPTPTSSFAIFGDGTFTVGKDIQPGTYRTRQGSSGCYYARLKGFGGTVGDIISNNNTDNAAIITIAASDKGFESQGCGTWTADLSAITSNKQSFGDGEYIVGTDITPGTYKSSGQSGCYYARLSGFSGEIGGIIANNNTDNAAIITIAASDKGFESQNCGTWTR